MKLKRSRGNTRYGRREWKRIIRTERRWKIRRADELKARVMAKDLHTVTVSAPG